MTTQKPGTHPSLPNETHVRKDGSAVGQQDAGKSSAKPSRSAAPGVVPKADKNAKSGKPDAGGHSTAIQSEGVRKGPDAAGRSGRATGNGASRASNGDKGQSGKDRGSKGNGKSDKGKSGKHTQ
jgi:hypothetical protein